MGFDKSQKVLLPINLEELSASQMEGGNTLKRPRKARNRVKQLDRMHMISQDGSVFTLWRTTGGSK